jgi:peptide-methionine (S)-S-oxide reductase
MQTQLITLGGGCFWCLEAVYQELEGVHQVISGYAGGFVEFPDYESVCDGTTGHAEVVQIHFDPQIISIRQILEVFFVIHDPTTLNRQGHDVGSQYRSVIYCEDENQINQALDVIAELKTQQVYRDPIVTEIMLAPTFYKAEEYHQNYFVTHPFQGYCMGVIAPKLEKFRKTFAQLKKKSN